MGQQMYEIADIKAMLVGRIDDVIDRYAPAAAGSYTQQGKYWTLNPGRPDRTVGSFCIHMSGPMAGEWHDYALSGRGAHGDLIDLIAMACNCSLGDAIKEARAILGLETADPAMARRLQEQRRMAAQRRAEREKADRKNQQAASRKAFGLWLSGQERLRGTPADYYLQGRGINLTRLGRQPRALRFHPALYFLEHDPETGEVFEAELPAMLAKIDGPNGKCCAVHRTYLQLVDGVWQKAKVRAPKKVMGCFARGAIRISTGRGPNGGKGAPLAQCPPGTHVFLTEGIEDALSAMILLPNERILAGVSLGNLGQVGLPKNVSRVTIIGDNDGPDDGGPGAQAALQSAIRQHQEMGREVRLWQNKHGGKDLNDALRAGNPAVARPQSSHGGGGRGSGGRGAELAAPASRPSSMQI